MVSRSLLVDAAKVCLEAGHGGFQLVQRRARVGFATASQLLEALEAAEVLGPWQGSRRPVKYGPGELDAAIAAIDEAITDGRVVLS